MIKNNKEFRIGNLVCDALTGEWMEVDAVTTDQITMVVIDHSKLPLPNGWQMTPIPLTDEILEKVFGWNNTSAVSLDQYECGDIYLEKDPDGIYYQALNNGEYHIGAQLTYVHELQNRHFYFTGEELSVNLTHGTNWVKKAD